MSTPKSPVVELSQSSKDDLTRHKMFTTYSIRAVAELRKYLASDSVNKKGLGVEFVASARDYVISGMMDEAEKAAISCLQTSSFILESQASDALKTDVERQEVEAMKQEMPHIEEQLFQSRIDELTVWERKLTEQLVDLVGFRHARADAYYRHYALLRERERLKKIASDFQHYHAANNRNLQHQIDHLEQRIDKLLLKLDTSKCWYVKSADSTKKSRFMIADFRQRLNTVLPWMTGGQRLTAGISYAEYNIQSGNLHPGQVKIKDEDATMKTLDNHFMRVSMLVTEVVFAAMDARSMYNTKGWLGDFARGTRGNEYPATLLKELTQPAIEKGDFVLAHGDLAEVAKVNRSEYGYRGFRVKYLETPPIPSIPVDEMPARYVKLLHKRRDIDGELRALLASDGIYKPSTRQINTAIRKQVLDMWTNMGYREIAFGDHEAGHRKMTAYIDNLKNMRKK